MRLNQIELIVKFLLGADALPSQAQCLPYPSLKCWCPSGPTPSPLISSLFLVIASVTWAAFTKYKLTPNKNKDYHLLSTYYVPDPVLYNHQPS